MTTYAAQTDKNENYAEGTPSTAKEELVVVQDIAPSETSYLENMDILNGSTSIEIETSMEAIDASVEINQRTANRLPNNPKSVITGQLTASDSVGIHLFSVTSNKFLVAMLDGTATNCNVRIYYADMSTGTLTPSNLASVAGNLMVLNNLPVGDYAFVVSSTDSAPNISYKLNVNVTNPSGSIKNVCWRSSDLQKLGLLYTSGALYADGVLAFDYNNPTQKNLDWTVESIICRLTMLSAKKHPEILMQAILTQA